MNMHLNEAQRITRDTLRKLLGDHYSFAQRRQIIDADKGFSRGIWGQIAELGLLAQPCPERLGGYGGNAVDIVLVSEELGRHLVLEPYLPSAVLASGILQHSAGVWRSRLLPKLLNGSTIASFAYLETRPRHKTLATYQKSGFILNGSKFMALAAPQADYLLVTANLDDCADSTGIFLIDKQSQGLTLNAYQLIDGRPAANLHLNHVYVDADQMLISADQTESVIRDILNIAAISLCAEAIGCISALIEKTVAYTKSRRQFGATLSSFQVIQHRLASIYMQQQQARPLVYAAAARLAAKTPDSHMMVSAAKAFTDKAGLFAGQNAVQLHGGMGITEELDIGHYFKRLTAIQQLFGTRTEHLRQFADYRFSHPNTNSDHTTLSRQPDQELL